MKVSLAEVQYMARRACVGAGFPHGLADDTARAVRWLCERGLPGLENLQRLVRDGDPGALSRSPPAIAGTVWRWSGAGDAPIFPLDLGPAMAELALVAGDRRPATIEFSALMAPLLLLPWAAKLADQAGKAVAVTIAMPGASHDYLIQPGGVVHGPARADVCEGLGEVRVDLAGNWLSGEPALDGMRALAEGVTAPDELWAALGGHAHRSYVEATAESRQRGAGAGLTDND